MNQDQTPTPISLPVSQAQADLLDIANELHRLDGRLAALAEALAPRPGDLLRGELAAGAECVRNDLLGDAVDTLTVLAHQTGAGALARREQIEFTASRLLACA